MRVMQSSSNTVEGSIIGLDVGDRRIGVARINTFAKLSEPLNPIVTASQEPFKAILTVIKEYGAISIVVGLPRGLDGQETAQTQKIREFTALLKQKSPIPVFMIDEAGTSKQAKERITKANPSIDSNAAAIILEDFVNFADKERLKVK